MSDYESGQRMRNIVVGVFVVAALCALVWLVFKFGDLPTVVSKLRSFEVDVQFPTAPGVQKETPVRFCGYQIGRVTKVMAPAIYEDLNTGLEYHQTKVIISIEKRYVNIPSNVEVKLMTRGFGSSYIELKAPLPDPNYLVSEFLADGSLLQGSTGMTSEFFPEESQEKLEKLVDGLVALINNANDIIGDTDNKENIKTSLSNLAEASERAKRALEKFEKFFAAAIETSEELSKATAQLRVILGKVNEGQGTVAKLVNDGRLYENLLENTEQMKVLLEEMEAFMAKSREKGVPIKLK